MTAFCLVGFVALAESPVMTKYLVNVSLLSTNLSIHIVVHLILVHPELSRYFQFDL